MLTQEEKQEILSDFPNVKLCYENILHKKVYPLNNTFMIGIPHGKKCFTWFTTYKEQSVCFILELDNTIRKQIKNIKMINSCFSSVLCYGTIFYGTLFNHMNNSFFSIEDIYNYKGKDISMLDFNSKINKICSILKNEIKQLSYNNNFVIFGLPIISKSNDNFEDQLSKITYRIDSIQYRNFNKNNTYYLLAFDKFINKTEEIIHTNLNKINEKQSLSLPKQSLPKQTLPKQTLPKQTKIFIVKPDIQNDIYNLYTLDNEYIGLASIPDYKTSVMMNKLFRTIKENIDLDALEESDEEEEFENPNIDKFVQLDKSYKMVCNFNNKFKKWIPIKILE